MSQLKKPKSKWKKGLLKDLVFFQRGFDITKAEQIDGDIPVISSSGIASYHINARVKGPGVVIGRKGTLGTVFYSESDYWPHDTTLWSKKLNNNFPRFVYYYLKTLKLENFNVGNANPTLNRNHIHSLKILIPDKSAQEKIAGILSDYDNSISVNGQRIRLLEEAARLLFREWFVYFRFPGYEKAKFEDRDGIQTPVGWDYLPITKVKIFKKTKVGVSVFIDTRQYYQTSEIDGTNLVGSGEEVDYENRPSRADVAPRLNSVYFAKMKDADKVVYFNKGNAELLERILLSTGMVGFSTDEKYLSFLFGLLTSYEFVQNKNNYATGATQVSLSDGGLKKIKVILPKLELIEKYSSIINPFLEECSYLRRQNQKLAQARDLLLPRLMSGKIEV